MTRAALMNNYGTPPVTFEKAETFEETGEDQP